MMCLTVIGSIVYNTDTFFCCETLIVLMLFTVVKDQTGQPYNVITESKQLHNKPEVIFF